MFNYFIFLYILQLLSVVKSNYFCNFSCGEDHTVCQREPCFTSKACGAEAKSLHMDDEARAWIVDVHNKYRNNIALGNDTRGGNSRAANMHILSYDRELEFVAQCWSNACRDTGETHDSCRSTIKFPHVGQNMYTASSSVSKNFSDKKWLTRAVESWYSEINMTSPSGVNSFTSAEGIGHFTQLVWAETTHIGCGRTNYTALNGSNSIYIYCNYGTSGNMLGQPVYKRGAPCSQCGNNKCNSKYTGLCEEGYNLYNDTWIPPFKMAGYTLQGSPYIIILLIIIFNFLSF